MAWGGFGLTRNTLPRVQGNLTGTGHRDDVLQPHALPALLSWVRAPSCWPWVRAMSCRPWVRALSCCRGSGRCPAVPGSGRCSAGRGSGAVTQDDNDNAPIEQRIVKDVLRQEEVTRWTGQHVHPDNISGMCWGDQCEPTTATVWSTRRSKFCSRSGKRSLRRLRRGCSCPRDSVAWTTTTTAVVSHTSDFL